MTRSEMVDLINEKGYASIHDCNRSETKPADENKFFYLTVCELRSIIAEYQTLPEDEETFEETMTNIEDEEITLLCRVHDPEGFTSIIFVNGDIKEFPTYDSAWKYARNHGFID